MITNVEVHGATQVAAELVSAGLQAPVRAAVVQRTVGTVVQARLAAGVPYAGTPPYVYRESWEVEATAEGGNPELVVFSMVPYAERLERGFQTIDRLGRRYQQVAIPTVDPLLEGIEDVYENAMAAGILPVR